MQCVNLSHLDRLTQPKSLSYQGYATRKRQLCALGLPQVRALFAFWVSRQSTDTAHRFKHQTGLRGQRGSGQTGMFHGFKARIYWVKCLSQGSGP